jgi:hypothetical protein
VVAVITVSFGQLLITGAPASVTVTLKLQLAVLPPASVAVNVTIVVPAGNDVPEV